MGDSGDRTSGPGSPEETPIPRSDDWIQIGDLSHRVGVSCATIRYYEREHLLPEAVRTRGGYRLYGPRDVERLRFVVSAKRYGFSLAQIRILLLAFEHPDDLARGKIAEVIERHNESCLTELERLTVTARLCDRLLRTYDEERRRFEQKLIDSVLDEDS